jgi:hypothetical protein
MTHRLDDGDSKNLWNVGKICTQKTVVCDDCTFKYISCSVIQLLYKMASDMRICVFTWKRICQTGSAGVHKKPLGI